MHYEILPGIRSRCRNVALITAGNANGRTDWKLPFDETHDKKISPVAANGGDAAAIASN